jgi:hypothetical protein
MIPLGKENLIHFTTLRCQPMAIMADRLRIAGILLRNRFHHP